MSKRFSLGIKYICSSRFSPNMQSGDNRESHQFTRICKGNLQKLSEFTKLNLQEFTVFWGIYRNLRKRHSQIRIYVFLQIRKNLQVAPPNSQEFTRFLRFARIYKFNSHSQEFTNAWKRTAFSKKRCNIEGSWRAHFKCSTTSNFCCRIRLTLFFLLPYWGKTKTENHELKDSVWGFIFIIWDTVSMSNSSSFSFPLEGLIF